MTDAKTQSEGANEVAVLVPAAGMGTRLGGRRKQFRHLGDRPLLAQTLLVFERHPGVGHIIVAAPEAEVRDVSDQLQAEGLSKLTAVVSGGTTRQDSVRHALRAVPAPVEVVLVHDAVRPFVRQDHVTQVIDATRTHGAAALAVPVADTLRRVDDAVFGDTVPRSDLYRMQTPQAFRRAWLEEAHAAAYAASKDAPDVDTAWDDALATDDVELVQRAGRTVHVVEGSTRNFKITTPSDWSLAEQLWPHWTSETTVPETSAAS